MAPAIKAPTFVIAGGQRCGTTWLCHLLDEHPEIYIAKPLRPEPKFFLQDSIGENERDHYLRTWFAAATDETAIGEKSTSYMESPGVPARMKQLFPNLKVVFILRHPIERAISNYRLSKQHGLETESLDFALRHEAQRVDQTTYPNVSGHPLAYLRRGCYATYIEHYLKVFDFAEMKILIKEELDERLDELLEELFGFLGVADFAPQAVDTRRNSIQTEGLTIGRDLVEHLIEYFRPSNRRLEQLIGCDVTCWDGPTSALKAMSVK